MALHTELPIHKVAYDLLLAVTGLSKNMPREHKGVYGGKLRDEAAEVISAIFKANVSTAKEKHLQELQVHLKLLELWLRVSSDMRWISTDQYAKAIAQTQSIGKQATGWRRKFLSSVS